MEFRRRLPPSSTLLMAGCLAESLSNTAMLSIFYRNHPPRDTAVDILSDYPFLLC